jgi:acetyl esterase/lipase
VRRVLAGLGALVSGLAVSSVPAAIATTATTAPTVSAEATAVIEPSADLVDGQRVTFTGAGFPANGFVVVAQCAASATEFRQCGNFSYPDHPTGPDGSVTVQLVLDALLLAGAVETDCRAPDACFLAAGQNFDGDLASAVRVALEFDPGAALAPPPRLTLQPDAGLVDGQQVTITGTGFVRESGAAVMQCVASPTDHDDCDSFTQQFDAVEADGSFTTSYTLAGSIETPRSGAVDCRPAGACVLAGSDRFFEPFRDLALAPLVFDPEAPLFPPPAATVAPDRNLVDGQVVTVEGEGFRPGRELTIAQCAPDATSFEACQFFTAQHLLAEADGRFSVELTLFATFTTSGREQVEVDCRSSTTSCLVVAAQRGFTAPGAAHIEVHFDPAAPLLPPPELTVTPNDDIADGATVTVRGAGFRPGGFVPVELCESGSNGERCDRNAHDFATADSNGAFIVTLLVFAELDLYSGASIDCRQPPGCEVIALDQTRGRHARALVGFGPPAPSRGRYLDRIFADAEVTRDVVYRSTIDYQGNPVELHLDVWQPKGDTLERRPLMIWMHGGYFVFGNKSSMDSYAREFARRGYVAVSLQYRLRPGVRINDAPSLVAAGHDAYDDATAAVEWLKEHADDYRIDPEKVAAGGYSAGAVTALNLAYFPGQRGPSSSTIGAAVSIAGLTFGAPEPGEPPAIAFHGTNDTTLPISASEGACLHAGAAGVYCEVVRYEGSGHEIVSTRQRDIVRRTADFLKVWLIDASRARPTATPTRVSGTVILASAGSLATTGYDPRPLTAAGAMLVLAGFVVVGIARTTARHTAV